MFRFCDIRSGLLKTEMKVCGFMQSWNDLIIHAWLQVRYHFLVSEARSIEQKLQDIAEKVKDCDDDMEDEVVVKITELNAKLEQIQQDVEILLNPSTRYSFNSIYPTFPL